MRRDLPREECGIFGCRILNEEPAAPVIVNGLIMLQHRGQDSAGVATYDGRFHIHKDVGLTTQVFTPDKVNRLTGPLGIGHVRYSTTGMPSVQDAQPFFASYPRRGIAFAHNGNLVNLIELRRLLLRQGWSLLSRCDGEVLMGVLATALETYRDLQQALERVSTQVEGAYSAVFISGEGELVAIRDPHGFRPLSYGRSDEGAYAASESVAIQVFSTKQIDDVEPGTAVRVDREGNIEIVRFAKSNPRFCMFEFVYFSRPESVVMNRCVYDVRIKLGEMLAKYHDVNVDVIVPVPDTARPAAEGYSRVTGIPTREGLMKNRYIGRTFIMPPTADRSFSVRMKLTPVPSVIRGKRVLLIDDSIVRGTTMRQIVQLLKSAGAKEVHVRVTCPPIIGPCFYGIDISRHEELAAHGRTVEEICKMIGADSLVYQRIDDLVSAIGLPREKLCLACLTHEYPTDRAAAIAERMRSVSGFRERYWEAEI